ncbi:MAG: hypothetical protein ACMXYC_03335 [Candidatus Woesearchaeota archaeon]
MHAVALDILSLLRVHPTLTSTQLASLLYPDIMGQVTFVLQDKVSDSKQKRQAMAQKAVLQRRILHHLHVLEQKKAIRIVHVGHKGEKTYAGVYEVSSTPVQNPGTPILGYEQKKIVYRFGQDAWAAKLNAVFFQCSQYETLQEMNTTLFELMVYVNDCIIINESESLFTRFSLESILEAIFMWERQSKDYDIRLCFSFNSRALDRFDVVLNFFRTVLPLVSSSLLFVFYVTGRELMQKNTFYEEIIRLFSYYKRKLNIKNNDLLSSPLGVGKSGPYSFYQWDKKQTQPFFGCVQSTVIVDIKRFFDEYTQASAFHVMMEKIAQTLFEVNALQRRYAQQYFPVLSRNNTHQYLFSHSCQLIRFWNTEFEHPLMNRAEIITLLESVKETLLLFSQTQRIIYNSCGMPCRFFLQFATAYRKAMGYNFFEAYDRITLRSMGELYHKRLKEELLFKEQLSTLCNAGNEVRFYREGSVEASDVLKELQAILYLYKLPFFCYNFAHRSSTSLTLQQFMEDSL